MNSSSVLAFIKAVLFPRFYIASKIHANDPGATSPVSRVLHLSYPLAIGFWFCVLVIALVGGALDSAGGGWLLIVAAFWIIALTIGWAISAIFRRPKY